MGATHAASTGAASPCRSSTPTLLGTMILLFGNAFGAQATAYQLTGGRSPRARCSSAPRSRGDVLHNPGLGYAMAMGMVAIMGVSIVVYTMPPAASGAVAAMRRRRRLGIGLVARRSLHRRRS